jgi:AcrR family transcriptional regulator
VIAERGPEAASIEDFVVAASVSRGTFYNYFPTIDDLLLAVRGRIAEALARALDATLPATLTPSSKLAIRLHSYLAQVNRDPAWGWVVLRLDNSTVGRQPMLEASFGRIFDEGVAIGEFRDIDVAAARTLAFGMSRMAQRDILLGSARPGHEIRVIALLLVAFGLSPEEADQVSVESARAAEALL